MAIGYKLEDDYNREGPLTFGGVPGVFSKSEPTAIDDIGDHDEKSFDALVKELGLPLKKVKGAEPASAQAEAEAKAKAKAEEQEG